MTSGSLDRWSDGAAYEAFMGRWSRPLAERFVQWLDAPDGRHWLDVGAGTGALAAAICRVATPASVVASTRLTRSSILRRVDYATLAYASRSRASASFLRAKKDMTWRCRAWR